MPSSLAMSTIRALLLWDDRAYRQLCERARRNQRSLRGEVRAILLAVLKREERSQAARARKRGRQRGISRS